MRNKYDSLTNRYFNDSDYSFRLSITQDQLAADQEEEQENHTSHRSWKGDGAETDQRVDAEADGKNHHDSCGNVEPGHNETSP